MLPLTSRISMANIKEESTSDKSVIFIWLSGGISQIEFINPIPNAPVEYRSVRGFTKTHDDVIGADFTKLASISKELTIVRSMKHRDNNHATASSWVMSGEPNFANNNKWPAYGAVMQKKYGTNYDRNGMPLYVKTSQIESDDAEFLGMKYNGFDASLDGLKDLKLDVTKERFYGRLNTLGVVDGKLKGGVYDDYSDLKEQAVKFILGGGADALDLSQESQENQTKFNISNKFGKDILLSVRLIENGARFVTVQNGGWDMHNGINQGFATKGPELDNYIFLLKTELQKRGMLENTMIVVTSEFSRTAKVNNNAGRDHMSSTNSLLLLGGGYEHGRVIGKTNATANIVEEDEFSPKDLSVTIFDHLGISERFVITDNQNRPRELYDTKAKNILKV